MQGHVDAAEARARLAEFAAVRRPGDTVFADLVALYYDALPEDDAGERKIEDIYSVAAAHLDLGDVRRRGVPVVRVLSPDGADGWQTTHSVVLAVTDDMPFLVDTMRMLLERHGLDVHLLVHPMLVVERDAADRLVSVALVDTATDAPRPAGSLLEAWMEVEIDRVDGALADELEAELVTSVADVRRVVSDFDAMRERLHSVISAHPALAWFETGHLVFLGAVDVRTRDDGSVTPLPATGLGQLRPEACNADALAYVSFPTSTGAREARPAVVARADTISTVFRPQRETVVIVTDPADPTLQHRFVGLFSTAAQRASVLDIPGFGDEIAAQLHLAGEMVHSHYGRAARTTLESLPRDMVLELSASEVAALVREIVGLQERRLVRVLEVPEPVGLWTAVLVYFPRSRFTAELPAQLADIVAGAYGAEQRTFESFVGTSSLARVTVGVRRPTMGASADLDELERTIDAQSTSWNDRLLTAAIAELGERSGRRLFERLGASASASYRAAVAPERAVADLRQVAEVLDGVSGLVTSLDPQPDADTAEWRFRVYRRGVPMMLFELLPLLDDLGLVAQDEQPFTFSAVSASALEARSSPRAEPGLHPVSPSALEARSSPRAEPGLHPTTPGAGPADAVGDGPSDANACVYLYDIGVRVPDEVVLDEARRNDLQKAFAGLVDGVIESDGFNRLVLLAGLDAREVAMLRAYAKYLRQIGFAFSQRYIEATLAKHPHLVGLLVELFAARFDPTRPAGERDAAIDAARGAITDALDVIPSLDEDRIGRSFFTLINATVRTNYYRDRVTIAFKLDPSAIPELPLPRPAHEIWVCGPRVEGVHLRGGPIARGGLRWSDRREDFRTEVLGLMKAQMVKNAVIVPTGAKGGFVVKRPLPDPEANRAEVVTCYQTFIRSMLDLTDNLRGGVAVHPPDTIIHDSDDTYLVVAADKGTATFSDVANAISAEYGFWLGDAFASGGSVGYDHKVMGITARGAWESVRRHARALGRDADADPITAVGIGDMSGDVFGNGMLRSRAMRLVAAFDHRHIFIDPNPDAEAAFAERQRLFELARSSWADYDTALLSAGGAIYPRTQKSIDLSPQARAAIGVGAGALTADQLVRAVLTAPVDLLWNGGIGTYVKAETETNADVGDRANDAVRINGLQLRCRMVGEGGNLGFTQLGRVEYALAGGLIYTDAIDNSAGVDCSDHEVNIKILLDGLVAAGELTGAQRNELLASMTDEVAALVLAHNTAQTLALVMARRQAAAMANVHARYIDVLETEGWLDRALEFLPTDKQIAERQLAGGGLTTPEFAVLIAYTKNTNVAEMVRSDLPDSRVFEPDLLQYFPRPLRERIPTAIAEHPLRREIISTVVVNQMVNLSGITFDHRMTEDTGASVVDVIRAWVVARDVFDFAALWAEIDGIQRSVAQDVQIDLFLDCRRMIERSALWVLRHRRPPFDLAAITAQFRPGIAELAATLGTMLKGRMADVVLSGEASRLTAGVPEDLAERAGVWPLLHTGFDLVELSEATGHPLAELASVQWSLFDVLDLMWLWEAIGTLPRADRWQTQARSALRDDLLSTLAELTEACVTSGSTLHPETAVDDWLETNARSVARVGAMLTEIRRAGTFDLTSLSVALRQLRNLSLTSITM